MFENRWCKMNRKLSKRDVTERIFWCVLIAPSVLIVTLFIVIPIIDSIFKSFTDYKLVNIVKGIAPEWNQFANYIKLFDSGVLTDSAVITFTFVIVTTVLSLAIGMSLALVLNSGIKGARIFRSLMMTPWVVPTVISALVWIWIYQPQYGLLRYLVNLVTFGHVSDFAILNSSKTALAGVVIVALWKQIPLMTLLLLAGLQNVPTDILEAAQLDGANGAVGFFKITVPYMSSVIKTSVSMIIIDNFKQFPLFWQMTSGGPNGSTTTFAVLSYKEAFIGHNFGSGAAVTTIWMLVMILFVFFYNKLFPKTDFD